MWQNEDREQLSLIEEEAVGLSGTPGFRTEAMLLATPVGLFIQGQKRMNVAGFSIDDGRFLWSRKKFHNNPNMLYADGRLYISGIERNGAVQVIDPQTGESVEDLHFFKGSCTRMTGSPEALYCRGEGLGRYDFAQKLYTAERSARPGCNDGAIAANGLLYVGPWLCDCNLSILGQMVLAPAHDFEAHGQVLSDDRLEQGESRPLDRLLGAGRTSTGPCIGRTTSERARRPPLSLPRPACFGRARRRRNRPCKPRPSPPANPCSSRARTDSSAALTPSEARRDGGLPRAGRCWPRRRFGTAASLSAPATVTCTAWTR